MGVSQGEPGTGYELHQALDMIPEILHYKQFVNVTTLHLKSHLVQKYYQLNLLKVLKVIIYSCGPNIEYTS